MRKRHIKKKSTYLFRPKTIPTNKVMPKTDMHVNRYKYAMIVLLQVLQEAHGARPDMRLIPDMNNRLSEQAYGNAHCHCRPCGRMRDGYCKAPVQTSAGRQAQRTIGFKV